MVVELGMGGGRVGKGEIGREEGPNVFDVPGNTLDDNSGAVRATVFSR